MGPGWLSGLGSWFDSTLQITVAYHQYGVSSRPLCTIQKRVHLTHNTCDEVCQLPAQGRWFSLGTPTSSTTKIDRYDIG